MDGHYCIISWFAKAKITVKDGVVKSTPLWCDYLTGFSLGEIVEFCKLNGYILDEPNNDSDRRDDYLTVDDAHRLTG